MQRINHHYAHALSCWPVNDTRPDIEVVIDGEGDLNHAWSVFKNMRLIERGYETENGSVGQEMTKSGMWLNIEYDDRSGYDISGKLMGLQSYGNHVQEFVDFLPDNIYETKGIFDRQRWFDFIGDELVGSLKPLDWIRTVHNHMGDDAPTTPSKSVERISPPHRKKYRELWEG